MSHDLHRGHRDRLKQRFLNEGLDSFDPHQALELLLFYAIPRQDTNPLAHVLLNTFGSLPAVLEASYDQLCRVKGVSEHTAILLKLCNDMFRRCNQDRNSAITSFKSLSEIGPFLSPRFYGLKRELALLLCLNNRCEVLNVVTLSTGTINHAVIDIREVVQVTLEQQAPIVILAHNHPFGGPDPSPDDLAATRQISSSLELMGVRFIDHIIYSADTFLSMRSAPQFAALFSE